MAIIHLFDRYAIDRFFCAFSTNRWCLFAFMAAQQRPQLHHGRSLLLMYYIILLKHNTDTSFNRHHSMKLSMAFWYAHRWQMCHKILYIHICLSIRYAIKCKQFSMVKVVIISEASLLSPHFLSHRQFYLHSSTSSIDHMPFTVQNTWNNNYCYYFLS